jgi:hypothetical protein
MQPRYLFSRGLAWAALLYMVLVLIFMLVAGTVVR